MEPIEFSKPPKSSKAERYLGEVIKGSHLAGDGPFCKAAEKFLLDHFGGRATFLTPSCTAALEMANVVAGFKPGDEVVVPSFTFSSTANACVLLGLTPVFVDVDPVFLNVDPDQVDRACGPKTRAVIPIHYAGVACDMDRLADLAKARGIDIIEDAAQCVGAKFKNKYLGTLGRFGCFSFHETKNLGCGEGGALMVRDEGDLERAQIARDKGTNRKKFLRGMVDKYTWVDSGSSYLMPELSAALLLSQLEEHERINDQRRSIWEFYRQGVEKSPTIAKVAAPQSMPSYAETNAHIYFLLLPSGDLRDRLLAYLREQKVMATSHYQPLHSSFAGQKFGRTVGDLRNSEMASRQILRLPLYSDMTESHAARVLEVVEAGIRKLS